MAIRKKAKKKTRKAVKTKRVTRKKAPKKARRPALRPKAKPKKKAARAPAKPRKTAKARVKPAPRAAAAAPQAVPAVPANEERIGVVTHYFSHLGVAILKLDSGALREGETIHIKGHTSDFRQTVGSMEVNHVHVSMARAGESFGLKVKEHAREHDVVYRVKAA